MKKTLSMTHLDKVAGGLEHPYTEKEDDIFSKSAIYEL